MMNKYSTEIVTEMVEREGLGYAIQHYLSGDSIEDPELAKMWDEAKTLLDRIEVHLEDEMRKSDSSWEWS